MSCRAFNHVLHNSGKKSKENEDRGSMSSLDLINSTEGAATALYTYEPPPNACGSAIAVQKGKTVYSGLFYKRLYTYCDKIPTFINFDILIDLLLFMINCDFFKFWF